jgi:uncharacterized protein (DUF1015 family)
LVDAAPFTALRYDPEVAGHPAATSAPAYDLIEPISYTQHRTANPYTVLELLAPEDAYARSRQLLTRWRRNGVLVPTGPAFFRYEEHELAVGEDEVIHSQRGLLAAVRLESLDGGVILPHEEVDTARVAARLRRLEAVPAELDPVYMVLDDPPEELTRLLTSVPPGPPIVAVADEQGTDHRIWALSDPGTQERLRGLLTGTRAMIADGHHRYARSLAFRDRRRSQRAAAAGTSRSSAGTATSEGGPEPSWERVFAYLVDPRAGGPRIEALHRLLAPVSAAQLQLLRADFEVREAPADPGRLLALLQRTSGLAFGLIEPGGGGRLLRAVDDAALRSRLPTERSETYRRLEAAVLTHAVLPRLGLPAAAVTAIADPVRAAEAVSARADAALLLLRPPPFRVVLELASRHERLPYKSTRFLPKPRTGLLIRPLDANGDGLPVTSD